MPFRCLLTLLAILGAPWGNAECDAGLASTKAIQDIEYLRKAYARATDRIGENADAEVESGRRVYHRVFTADATIGATGFEAARKGPDAWVDVVLGALGPMGPTQHLVGSQVVVIDTLDLDGNCAVIAGTAHMDSYLQAWHTLPDGKIWLFFGNYKDKVVYTPTVGWQIADSYLERITEDTR